MSYHGRRQFNSRKFRQFVKSLTIVYLMIATGAVGALVIEPLLPSSWQDWINARQDAIAREVASPGRDTTSEKSSPATGPTVSFPSPTALASLGPTASTGAPTSEPTDRPPPTPLSLPSLKRSLLNLINSDRVAHGVSVVSLGDNAAAQAHSEEMLRNGYSSHWGLDGLAPYMRWTIAGGVNYSAENISAPAFPQTPGVSYNSIVSQQELKRAQEGLMDSPGHRDNILDPWHKKVSLGISCSDFSCAIVQHFQGVYIEFDQAPTLSSGILHMSGRLTEGFTFKQVVVWYDQPPHALTLGQLDVTECYDSGDTPAAFVVPPPPPGQRYISSYDPFSWEACVSPYTVEPETPRRQPLSPGAFRPSQPLVGLVDSPWVTADSWEAAGGRFEIRADLSSALESHGPGVYTVKIWGQKGEDEVPLTNFSIFVEES